jgi:hypothetical protein
LRMNAQPTHAVPASPCAFFPSRRRRAIASGRPDPPPTGVFLVAEGGERALSPQPTPDGRTVVAVAGSDPIRHPGDPATSSSRREFSSPEFPDSCQKPVGKGIGDSGCTGRDGRIAMVTDPTRGSGQAAGNRVCRAARSDTATFSEESTSNLQIGGFELPGDGGETTHAACRSADFDRVPCPARSLPDLGHAPDADREGGR